MTSSQKQIRGDFELGQKQRRFSDLPRQAVASRAYQIWESHGCPEATATEDWLQAEAELRDADQSKRRERPGPTLQNSVIDEASEESFPASDPPAWTHCSS